MKERIFTILTILVFTINGLFAQETINVMFYNLLNFPLQSVPANRINDLEVILTDYQPDLFLICELNNVEGANSILNVMQQSINPNYTSAAFVTNSSDDDFGDQNDLQNLLYYDSSKFILISQTEVATFFRDFNHYKLLLNSANQDTNPIYLDVIVCHLKASSGEDNANYRFQMIQDLETYLDTFPANSNVLLGGDLNLYTGSELAFQELIESSNNITFIDPADKIGSWHNNTNYIDVFTQSTRTATGLGGATGGFDDRFDFILTSEELISNPELNYISDSYQVYGNNSNISCYNQEINSNNCAGSEFSSTIRNSLYNFSDHLPVTLQLATNQSLGISEFTLQNAIEILGSNSVADILRLKINPTLINQPLKIYNSIGQLVETIETKNTTHIDVNVLSLSNGLYYIAVPQLNTNPLKFIIAN